MSQAAIEKVNINMMEFHDIPLVGNVVVHEPQYHQIIKDSAHGLDQSFGKLARLTRLAKSAGKIKSLSVYDKQRHTNSKPTR
ncbi:hypothetical protein N7471_007122 [Penicillium samsonianum]|uniref:uncharacterized protein n=1 Tax=Penicillium samsonianum TaxID=1882272 RepID=UPI002549A72E|nr:uncharacterized protein N7471_007122 [Penicillium samsonianum]KAJ6131907.1 hypothetical protein N7471_007122 [Penicillium samsonianum]